MPKKRVPKYDTKHSSPVHPSLSSNKLGNAAQSSGLDRDSTGRSVNDEIQRLRLSQGPSSSTSERQAAANIYNPTTNPSLPPSLRNILQLPDAPLPRPRPGLRVTAGRRGPAGPAAPQSWLRANRERGTRHSVGVPIEGNGMISHLEHLPDAYIPDDGSLLATTLRAVAKNWNWHKEYDQYYIATISVRYKEALLHYIAELSQFGIDREGLEVVFQDESELEDATGAEGLTHLDLATFLGHSLKFSDLKHSFSKSSSSHISDSNINTPPESWDDSEAPKPGPSVLGRFDSLTHLSLAHPNASAPWKGLLDLAPHLSTITHLSLSHWPAPPRAPHVKAAYRAPPPGTINYGASNLDSAHDHDWSEAASLLRRLSKSTYCLQWLDLTGCHPWSQALASPEIDWFGAWRALETIKIGQGWLPGCFQPGADQRGWRDLRLYSPSSPNEPLPAEAVRLHRWASNERDGMEVERKVNRRISVAVSVDAGEDEDVAEEGIREDLQVWQETGRRSPFEGQRASRTCRVVFDRGWNEWWIREAVEVMTKAPERQAMLDVLFMG